VGEPDVGEGADDHVARGVRVARARLALRRVTAEQQLVAAHGTGPVVQRLAGDVDRPRRRHLHRTGTDAAHAALLRALGAASSTPRRETERERVSTLRVAKGNTLSRTVTRMLRASTPLATGEADTRAVAVLSRRLVPVRRAVGKEPVVIARPAL